MDLSSPESLKGYFHEALSSAMRNQGLSSSAHTEFYLVNLLSGFATASIDDQPLALQLAEAAFAAPGERAHKLREVGDRSLYVSGFFADSLSRKSVDVGYYIRLGGGAYGQLALMPRPPAPSPEVFRELAQNFGRFVDVLAEVSEFGAVSSDRGVLQLYERWLRTGAGWIERRLRARGMLPGGGQVQ